MKALMLPGGCGNLPLSRIDLTMKTMEERSSRIADEWLVLQSQDGDVRAFEQLVARWQDRLWRHARRLVRDDTAAWDVVQDAWMSMLKGLRRLDDPGAFAGWAYRIVTFKCVDLLRRDERRRRAEDRAPTKEADPADDQEEDEEVRALRAALGELAVEQRAILSLHYREDLGVERIAAILGIPVGTVKSRLHRARAALKKKIERRRR
jgi:RNA polymerase sigma-70 factor (ECF subfamily)